MPILQIAGAAPAPDALDQAERRPVAEQTPPAFRAGAGDAQDLWRARRIVSFCGYRRLRHRVLNIEAIDMPDESWDVVVANHVLEHVDDRKALAEIRRVLTPGGFAIFSFPLALGFEQTYENPAITSRAERELHFGQWDHVRYYGADAADRIAAAGFEVETFSATEPHVHLHATARNSREFIAHRS